MSNSPFIEVTAAQLDNLLKEGLQKHEATVAKPVPQKNYSYYYLRTEELTKEVKELEFKIWKLKENLNGNTGSIKKLKEENKVMRAQLESLGCDVGVLLKSTTSTTTTTPVVENNTNLDVFSVLSQHINQVQQSPFVGMDQLSQEQLFGYQTIKEANE